MPGVAARSTVRAPLRARSETVAVRHSRAEAPDGCNSLESDAAARAATCSTSCPYRSWTRRARAAGSMSPAVARTWRAGVTSTMSSRSSTSGTARATPGSPA
ncbi:hypothetical protein [Streptomyces sp. HPF1205]|uniref:hypothetical protein n=1 Tax=Streptomyces sp. HPF1205 TaxID=2873262 RepID=UPI001CEC4E8E|nr:hypothetical protein [Streptomyces sp. HPF1205]